MLGLKDVIPLLIPVVPFGIIFGVIGIESGLGSTVTFLMSIIIFAGSSQLAFAQLFTSGATTPVIVSSVAIVNSRHFLYSAVIAQYLTKVKLFWKIILSYFLTDQAFMVSQKYFKQQPKNKDRHYHLLGSGFTLWFVWQLSTVAGIILGEVIPKELNDKLLRSLAENQNLRKIHEKEREDLIKYSSSSFAREILNLADNLERAFGLFFQIRWLQKGIV